MNGTLSRAVPVAVFAAFPVAIYGAQHLLHHATTYMTTFKIRNDINFINDSIDMIEEYDVINEGDIDLLHAVLVSVGFRVEKLMTSPICLTRWRGRALYYDLRRLYHRSHQLEGRLAELVLGIPKTRNIRPLNR